MGAACWTIIQAVDSVGNSLFWAEFDCRDSARLGCSVEAVTTASARAPTSHEHQPSENSHAGGRRRRPHLAAIGARSASGAPPPEHKQSSPGADAPAGRQPAIDADGVSLPAGYRLHEFEVQSKLGQGALHRLQGVRPPAQCVALKEYMPNGMARRAGNSEVLPQSPRSQEVFDIGLNSFVKEGVTLAKFDHPALVRVYRTFQANGTAYMIMQLVQGATLEEVARAMPTPPDEAWLLRLLDPLTAALQVVHDERIVHRDIAPDNVMILDGSKQPLLLDFGAARQVIGDSEQAPTAMLKPSYAPVEQYPDLG